MKIADYNQMMAYLTQQEVPSELPQPKPPELLDLQEQKRKDRLRGLMEELDPVLMDESKDFIEREEFDRGGVAKVLAHLDSLPEGTEIDLEYVRKYIADNNINADAKSIVDQLEPNKINRKQISSAGNETFTYKKEKRDLLTRLNKKLNIKKLKEFVPATKENLEKLDNLIKNTDLNIEQIGKELGFRNPKSFKFAPTTKNVLVKEYIKKYGSPPEGRFKITKLTPETKIVKEAIRLKELGLSTTQVANELNIDRSAIVNYFRAGGREDLVGQVNVKKEGTPESRKKANRMKKIKEGEKFASKSDKAFNKAEDERVRAINKYVKENAEELANNKKIQNLINLKLDLKGNILSKEKTPEEILKSIKRDRFFERDHISSVAKQKRNMQFPVNFQMSPYNINQGFFTSVETYVKRPDADPAKIEKISNVLDQYGLRLDTGKGIIGAKPIPASEIIDRNLKALNLPTDIGKSRSVTLGANLVTADDAKRLVDFSKIPQDLRNVSDEIIKPLAEKAVLYGPEYAKQLIQMSKPVAKFALAESTLGLGFAPFDIGEGRTMKEVALNVATLGTGIACKRCNGYYLRTQISLQFERGFVHSKDETIRSR